MSREELGDAVVAEAAGEGLFVRTAGRQTERPPPPPRPPGRPDPPDRPDRPDRSDQSGEPPGRPPEPPPRQPPENSSTPPPDPRDPSGGPDRTAGLRARLAVTGVVVAMSMTAGFLGARAWGDATSAAASLAGDPVAWAVIVDVRPGGGVARTVVDLGVHVTNLGRVPITISGSETTPDAGAVEAVAPDGLKIASGKVGEVQVHASVDCSSPQPLRLYPLQVRRADQTVHLVEITGGTAALARLCGSQPETAHVLVLTAVSEDDDHLRLTVSSPTGRTTQILRLRAGGVTLAAQPLRGGFDAHSRAIWIEQPRTCPVEWLRNGIPRTVIAEVDAGAPATVTLDVGYALARWLREGPCSGQGAVP